MTIPANIFAIVILVALVLVFAAPIVLAVLWVADRRKGDLW